MLVTLTLVPIFIACTVESSTFNIQLYNKSSYTSLRLTPMKERLTGSSLTLCGTECELTTNCVSFTYHPTGLCELNRYNPNDVLSTNHTDDGWEIFIKYPETCWPDTNYEGFVRNGTCYFWMIGTPPIPWEDGQSDCRENGAELVCIESEAENQALIDHVPKWLWWFGVNDLDNDNVFTCNGTSLEFKKWAPNKPGSTKCVAVHEEDTLWYDGGCHSDISYVCEKRLYF